MRAVKTDVLIVGGGIAGCFAAIAASRQAREVILLEKSTIRRGGAVGPGMDQIMLGIGGPVPGAPTLKEALNRAREEESRGSVQSFSSLMDPNIELLNAKDSYERLRDWEGIDPMIREEDGGYCVTYIPERFFFTLNVRGANLKVRLGEAVGKLPKVKVMERTMGVDLITSKRRVTGVYSVNTRTGEVTAFLAKSTVLTAGIAARQFLETPEGIYMTWHCPNNVGDAQAMAYRAGAELVNTEFGFMDYSSCREGGGVFGLHPYEKMPMLKNRLGERFVKTPEENKKRVILMVKEITEGRGPIYFDCSQMPEEEFKVLNRNLNHEYPITQKWFKQRGLNPRSDPIPVQLVPAGLYAMILTKPNGETSLKGLYAGGDTMAGEGSLAGATLTGYRAGESAAKNSVVAEEPDLEENQANQIEDLIEDYRKRMNGVDAIDLEETVRGLNTDYVGYYKSGGLMQKGLELLLDLKEVYLPKLYASDPHQLMRCLETRNLFEISEMHIRTSMMREETRFARMGMMHHVRLEFPETDQSWKKWIVVQRKEDTMTLTKRNIPKISDKITREVEKEIKRRE